jgi:protein required for attachment to host cells
MTVITWVVAADSRRARIFETHGLKLDLRQVGDLRNPRLSPADTADAADAADNERETFARTVAEFLERSRQQQRFDRLRLAVEPRFLGLLREHLTSDTRKLVYENAGDDVPDMDTPQIRRPLQRR